MAAVVVAAMLVDAAGEAVAAVGDGSSMIPVQLAVGFSSRKICCIKDKSRSAKSKEKLCLLWARCKEICSFGVGLVAEVGS